MRRSTPAALAPAALPARAPLSMVVACALLPALVACAPARPDAPALDAADATPGDPVPACALATLDPSCVAVPSEPIRLLGWCEVPQPASPLVVTSAAAWSDVLATCDVDIVDPLADNDWSREHVVGTMSMATGCSGSAGTSFVARCGGEHVLSYWSIGCGACDMAWTTTHFLLVPADEGIDTLLLSPCVPEGEECAG